MGLTRKRNDFGAGYHTSQSPQNTPKNALVAPSINILYDRNGHCRNFNGFSMLDGGGTMTYQLDNGWAAMGARETIDGALPVNIGSGNIIEYYNKSLIFVGTGTVKANFPSVFAGERIIGEASSTPKIAVLDIAGTDWDAPVDLGLAPVSVSPDVSIPTTKGTNFVGLVSGVRAFKVAARREATGGISDASPASQVLEYTKTSVLMVMPPVRTDGTSHWRIYATPAGFGNVGFFQQIPFEISEAQLQAGTVDLSNATGDDTVRIRSVQPAVVGQRQLEIEFNDQDLLALQAPENMFPASAASFVSALGNVLILLGTFKGVGLSPSIPNLPEAFPPDLASFISEPVTGVSRPASGFLYVMTQNSIWIGMMSGAVMGGTPIISRSLVTNIGIKHQKAAVTIGDALYIFSSGGKPIRISPEGQVESIFADRVIEAFTGWDASKVTVSYDEQANRVLFCHNKLIVSYDIDNDRWNSPVDLNQTTGLIGTNINIISAFTQDGVANIVWWNETLKKYVIGKFDKGLLGSVWKLREAWDDWGDYRVTKDMVYVSMVYKMLDAPINITGRIFKNFEAVHNEEFTVEVNNADMKTSRAISIRSYFMNVSAAQLSATGFGHTVLGFDSDVDIHRIN